MRFRSVRFRITAVATLIVAVVLSACAVIVVVVVKQQLEDNLDSSLAQRADQVEAATLIDPGTGLANTNQEDRFVQVLDAGGWVLFASANLAGRPAVVEPPSGDRAASTHSDIPIEDDLYRVLARRYSVDGVDRFVVVGENVDDVRDAVNTLIAVLVLTIPCAVAVLACAVWWLVGRTLRPVEQIRREVDSISLDQLGRRVPGPGTGDEIDRLAVTMNEMLARLEESAARQRQFVGDASHELRSPLTRMRTTLEVDLAHHADDLQATCNSTLDDVIVMQHLVDDLLFLARHDSLRLDDQRLLIDMDVVVEDEVRQLRETSRVEIDTSRVSGAEVLGNRSQLSRVVRNLLSNATRLATQRVTVALSSGERDVELVIDDDGPGIPAADRNRVFERFVRLDEARTAADGGAGLGLSIAHDIVTAHAGSITISESSNGGARLTVCLPKPV